MNLIKLLLFILEKRFLSLMLQVIIKFTLFYILINNFIKLLNILKLIIILSINLRGLSNTSI